MLIRYSEGRITLFAVELYWHLAVACDYWTVESVARPRGMLALADLANPEPTGIDPAAPQRTLHRL